MDEDTVDGDNFGEVWDAVVGNEGFEVCYDELFQGCWSVPAIENLGTMAVLLILLEIGFWIYVMNFICSIRNTRSSISS